MCSFFIHIGEFTELAYVTKRDSASAENPAWPDSIFSKEAIMSEQIGYECMQSTLVLHLPKEIDHHSSKEIREQTEEYLRTAGIRHIVFDFSQTTFMDSSGIGALLGRYKRMRDVGGSVMIYGADARIRRILRISGVDKLIPHVDEDT